MNRQQQDRLCAEAAEILVQGHLMAEGVTIAKAPFNTGGYDLMTAVYGMPSLRIQVKSRAATDFDRAFPVKNFDFDFLVFAAMNRGNRYGKRDKKDGKGPPCFWVFPVQLVQAAREKADDERKSNQWGKVWLKDFPDLSQHENAWHLISDEVSHE